MRTAVVAKRPMPLEAPDGMAGTRSARINSSDQIGAASTLAACRVSRVRAMR
jgi:hypothetical protein